MITYKKIVEDFETLVKNHKQLNSFGHGDINQLIYWTTQIDGTDNDTYAAPIYPLLYLVPQSVSRGEQQLTYTFDVIICDIDASTKTPVLNKQIWSDTLQIAEDILAQFKYSVTTAQGDYEQNYDITLPSTISPFSERFDDLLIGWTLSLQILIDNPLNRCISPYKPFN